MGKSKELNSRLWPGLATQGQGDSMLSSLSRIGRKFFYLKLATMISGLTERSPALSYHVPQLPLGIIQSCFVNPRIFRSWDAQQFQTHSAILVALRLMFLSITLDMTFLLAPSSSPIFKSEFPYCQKTSQRLPSPFYLWCKVKWLAQVHRASWCETQVTILSAVLFPLNLNIFICLPYLQLPKVMCQGEN